MAHNPHTAIHLALKVHGTLIIITPEDFRNPLNQTEGLVVVSSQSGLFTQQYIDLTSSKGLVLHCRKNEPLFIPTQYESFQAMSIHLPEY